MADNRGTLESLALLLADLLDPLRQRIAGGQIRLLFSELGVTFPPSLDSNGAFGAALQKTTDSTTSLVADIIELVKDINAEDYVKVAEKVKDVIVDLKGTIDSFETIANSLKSIAGSFPGIDVAGFADALPGRLFDYLVVRKCEDALGFAEGLEFAGIIERVDENVGSVDPAKPQFTRRSLHLDQLMSFLQSPAAHLTKLYQFDKPLFDEIPFFDNVAELLRSMGVPVLFDKTKVPLKLDLGVAEITARTDLNPLGFMLQLKEGLASNSSYSFSGDNWKTDVGIDFGFGANAKLIIQTDGKAIFIPPSGQVNGGMHVTGTAGTDTGPALMLLGDRNGSYVQAQTLSASAAVSFTSTGAQSEGVIDVNGQIKGGKIVIDLGGADGFIQKLVSSNGFEVDFDLLAGINSKKGFYIQGNGGLTIQLPLHLDIGPVEIQALDLGIGISDQGIPISLGVDIKASLGPMVAVIQNIGITINFSFPAGGKGNLGPLQLDFAFKPPNGVGLSLDSGVIQGGGFLSLNPDKGEYFGALELTFSGIIALKAIGIINTKMPDGSTGFALLILITAEFVPIQLGFGFTLNGVGGLIGVNRSTDLDALKTGVRSGAIESVLFPQDIIANITRIISDLKAIFPIVEDHFLLGPMAKLGWGTPTLITLELGIIIDIPVPRLVFLGVLKCILPTEDAAILRLQVNFDGGIDFDAGMIWFDASLFDSRLLIFTLTGDMALRIGWKDPMFVLSVGGFHPAFHEVPPDLTNMKRLGISLLSGDNPRLSVMTYFAITSNSVQSGAKVELYAAACGLNIYGFLGYDLLVQFSPFHLIADIYAGLALRSGTDVIMGIDVHCELSGPTPWNANGDASMTILFFTVHIGFNITWGDNGPAQPKESEDILPLVVAAISDDRNWKADMPQNTNLGVTFSKPDVPENVIVLYPFGVLGVSQKIVPLGLTINKFGNKKPAADTLFTMTYAAGDSTDNQEEFAIANFLLLSDSEKLSRHSFEQMKSGLVFQSGSSSVYGSLIDKDVNYEMSYVHRKKGLTIRMGIVKLFGGIFDVLVKGSAPSRSAFSRSRTFSNNAPARVDLPKPEYMVVNTSDMALHSPGSVAGSQAAAYDMHDALIRQDPSLQGTIQVVSAFELN